MTLKIVGKHMDIGEALTSRIEDRVSAAISKYFSRGYSGQITMDKRASEFIADCLLHLDSGTTLQASASAGDAHSAFDSAAEKLEKRLRRYKRRLKDHHAAAEPQVAFDASYTVIQMPQEEEEIEEDFVPAIVAESSKSIKTLSVAMAVMELDMADEPVQVFKNAGSGQINVVYRRSDGHIGWVDPQ